MANPQPLTCEEIADLHPAALHDYFAENARYRKEAPEGSQYSILFGSKSMFSGDTRELYLEFEKRVSEYRQAKKNKKPRR